MAAGYVNSKTGSLHELAVKFPLNDSELRPVFKLVSRNEIEMYFCVSELLTAHQLEGLSRSLSWENKGEL